MLWVSDCQIEQKISCGLKRWFWDLCCALFLKSGFGFSLTKRAAASRALERLALNSLSFARVCLSCGVSRSHWRPTPPKFQHKSDQQMSELFCRFTLHIITSTPPIHIIISDISQLLLSNRHNLVVPLRQRACDRWSWPHHLINRQFSKSSLRSCHSK